MIVREEGDRGLLITWPGPSAPEAGGAGPVLALHRWITSRKPAGLLEAVPALTSLLLIFDPRSVGPEELRRLIRDAPSAPADLPPGKTVEIPVKYGGREGPDLERVAAGSGLAPGEVIRRHAGAEHRVAFLGFAPGFPYLSGLPEELATPRLASPRPRVPAGSVAIAGPLSGIYPRESPGGWNIIGRTAERLCDFGSPEPILLQPGDRVVFRPVSTLGAPPPNGSPPAAGGIPAARVIESGLLTTVQDLGRSGHAHRGVPPSGPMDPLAFRLANLAAGNSEGEAALEFTFPGPRLAFLERAAVVLWGGDFAPRLSGRPAPMGRRLEVRAGEELSFGAIRSGQWAYLAFAGGLAAPRVLGSAAADLRSGIFGRLPAGAVLNLAGAPAGPARDLPAGLAPLPGDGAEVRFIPGAEEDLPSLDGQTTVLSALRDRSGYRTVSPAFPASDASLPSEGIPPGTIQLPPDGRMIFLLSDRPTTGGYRKLAFFASVDRRVIAQSAPGKGLRLRRITGEEARRLLREQAENLGTVTGFPGQ